MHTSISIIITITIIITIISITIIIIIIIATYYDCRKEPVRFDSLRFGTYPRAPLRARARSCTLPFMPVGFLMLLFMASLMMAAVAPQLARSIAPNAGLSTMLAES